MLAEIIGRRPGATAQSAGAGHSDWQEFELPFEFGDDPFEFRRALIRYWSLVATVDTESRRRALAALQSSMRWSGDRAARAVVLFVLGDTDAAIVYQAACGYLQSGRGLLAHRRFDDALEWLSRRLALRNDAVFAALLAHGDDVMRSQLLAQRHTTTSARMREIFGLLGLGIEQGADAFLREWYALETMGAG